MSIDFCATPTSCDHQSPRVAAFCDSTDHDGALVEATHTLNGRPLCAWHFEGLNPNPAAHGRW
ncbi:hypothetical protein [Pseudolysinimonas sp.]|uniref:hypothetical protein n=1 Tax=Pseudolysinimonas sp. TaxID=2680009 RepID=UPI003F7DDE06